MRGFSLTVQAPDARPTIALRHVAGANLDAITSPVDRAAVVDARNSTDVALGQTSR